MAVESFKCARHYLVCISTTGPTMVGPGKIFKMKALRRLENTILRLVFMQIQYFIREPLY